MLHLPQRTSLIAQAADALRQAIQNGLWLETLPGERELADRFQISRPTLREALKILQRDGIIDVAHGKRRRITGARSSARAPRLTVTAISEYPPHLMSPLTIFYMNELRKHMHKAGLQLEVLADHRLRSSRPEKVLESEVRQENVAAWILLSAQQRVQRWFARHGLPALVAGSCYPDVQLPSLDIDYRAVCRHAVGVLLGHGHRRIAFLTQADKVAGDEASEEGFLQAIAESSHNDTQSLLLRHDGTREDICRKLARLRRSSAPPTGLLVSRPSHLLTAFTYLQHSGVAIPKDLSIVSRDNDPYLNHVVPNIARYTFRRRHFADRLSRLAVQLATTGAVPLRQNRIIPQFIAGNTTGPPHPSPKTK